MSESPEARFLPEEVDKIRRLIVAHDATIACPRCGKELATSLPLAGGGTMAVVWELRCEGCRLSVVLSDSS